jgi:hypothetical protein
MRTISTQDLVIKINIITVAHHHGELTKGAAWKRLEKLECRCINEISFDCGTIKYLTNWKQLGMVRKAKVMLMASNR